MDHSQGGQFMNIEEMRALDALKTYKELEAAKQRVKRLEAAGDRMASILKSTRQHWYSTDQCEVVAFDWNEAKEAKP
jgi:hypothetical protein